MENSTIHDKRLNLSIGIIETDQKIDDDDLVYMDK